jgi:hypothetical protein
MTTQNRPTFKDRCSKALLGVDQVFSGLTTVKLKGTIWTLADIKATLSGAVDAANANDKAKQQKADAVANEREARAKAVALLSAMKAWVIGNSGTDASGPLGELGFEPPKPRKVSVQTKAVAQQKSAATRKARNTQGKVQREKVKGTVTPPEPSTTPAPKS